MAERRVLPGRARPPAARRRRSPPRPRSMPSCSSLPSSLDRDACRPGAIRAGCEPRACGRDVACPLALGVADRDLELRCAAARPVGLERRSEPRPALAGTCLPRRCLIPWLEYLHGRCRFTSTGVRTAMPSRSSSRCPTIRSPSARSAASRWSGSSTRSPSTSRARASTRPTTRRRARRPNDSGSKSESKGSDSGSGKSDSKRLGVGVELGLERLVELRLLGLSA